VRPALLLLAPLLACTVPNPAYLGLHDASVDRLEMDASRDFVLRDAAADPITQPDSARPEGRDAFQANDANGEGRDAFQANDANGDRPVGADGVTGGDAPIGAGLVLHWRFDELSGSAALDSSGRGFDGTFGGSPGPSPSTETAPTTFANPGSRRFDLAAEDNVLLASMPEALRPTQGLTVSVWFRTTQTTQGDLVSHGKDYFIRLDADDLLEFVRRRPPGSSSTWLSASGKAPAANDGQWHHAAGVASADGDTVIYMDGAPVNTDSQGLPFTYVTPSSLIVGRSMAGSHPFDGWLDEVRIYDRALTVDEIGALARGEP
jgi:hypothetical protein